MKKMFVVLLIFAMLFSTIAVTATSQNLGLQPASPDLSAAVEPTGTGAETYNGVMQIYKFTFEDENATSIMTKYEDHFIRTKYNDYVGEIVEWPEGSGNHCLRYELNYKTRINVGVHPYIWPEGIDDILTAQGDLEDTGSKLELNVDFAYAGSTKNSYLYPFVLFNDFEVYADHSSYAPGSNEFNTGTFTWSKYECGAPVNGLNNGGICFLDENTLADGAYMYVDNIELIWDGEWKNVSDAVVSYPNGTPAEGGIMPTTKTTKTTNTTKINTQSSSSQTMTTLPASEDAIVLWDGDVNRTYNSYHPIAIEELDQALRDDIAQNGFATEYFLYADADYVSGPSGYFTWALIRDGSGDDYLEYWPNSSDSGLFSRWNDSTQIRNMTGNVGLWVVADSFDDVIYVRHLQLIANHGAPITPTGLYTTTAQSQRPTTTRKLPPTLPNSEITPISHALKSNEVCVYSGVVNRVVLPQFIGNECGYVGILNTGVSSDGKTDNLMAAIRDDIVKNGVVDNYILYADVGEYKNSELWQFRPLYALEGVPGFDEGGTVYEQSWTDVANCGLDFSTMNVEDWCLTLAMQSDSYAYVKSIMLVAVRGEETDVTTRTTSGKEDAVWQIGNLSAEHDKVIEVPIDLVKNASGIWSFENTLQYDPTMLSFQGISINADFRQKGLIATGYEKDGVITLTGSAALFQTPCTATGTVATIQFKTVGPRGKFTAITGESIVRNTSNYSKTVDTFVFDGGVNIIDPAGGYDGPLAIDIGNVKADIGDVVSVPVIISGNPGFCNAEFSLNFDDTQLTFESVEWGSEFDAYFDKENCRNAELTDEGVLTFSALGLQKDKNCYTNGALATVTFKVNDTARSGKYFLIGNASRSGNLTVDGQHVSLDINDGAVRVRAEFPETASAETSGREGDTVFVPVVLNCETAVFSLNVDIKFNPAALFFLDAMIPDDPDFNATMSEDGTTLLISSSNPDKPLQGNIATIMQFQIAKGVGKGRQSVNAAVDAQSVVSMGSINQSLLGVSGGTVNVVEYVETLGDANGDNAVNMKDVLLMRKFLAGMDVMLDEANSDVNADGTVNMKDVLMLRKFLADMIDKLG